MDNPIPEAPPACLTREELTRCLHLADDVQTMLAPGGEWRDGVQRLLDGGHERPAVRVLAHVLPLRRAVWWAVLSAWHASDGKPSADEDAALAAAARWAMEPSEANRTAAEAAARVALGDNAAGCCASAAGLVGAAPESRHLFMPKDPLPAADLVAQAIFFAFAQRKDAALPVRLRQFVEIGIELFEPPLQSGAII